MCPGREGGEKFLGQNIPEKHRGGDEFMALERVKVNGPGKLGRQANTMPPTGEKKSQQKA